jgi:hypothetical protein
VVKIRENVWGGVVKQQQLKGESGGGGGDGDGIVSQTTSGVDAQYAGIPRGGL